MIKTFLKDLRRYYRDLNASSGSKVKVFNYQINDRQNYIIDNSIEVQNHWLLRFIENRGILKNYKNNVAVFGVNGNKTAININNSPIKIFYTIENVHVEMSPWYQYKDLLLDDNQISLSLGFDYLNHPKYLRFPYWLMAIFSPFETYDSIKKKCVEINNQVYLKRDNFCAFICRKDYFGDRIFFLNQMSMIDRVSCPGEFAHNDDSLKLDFGDNKHAYLKTFKFNLCPENSNSDGYVTEKIFDSFSSGAIPIYWGSNNSPEKQILNKDAYFCLSNVGSNDAIIKEINLINNNEKIYKEFVNQNRLTHDAHEYIFEFFDNLHNKLIEVIE